MSNAEIFCHNENFVLGIEWDNDVPYIHHDFYKFTTTIYKEFIVEYNKLEQSLKDRGCLEIWSYYDKNLPHITKFCEKFGYVKVGETDTQNIVLKEI